MKTNDAVLLSHGEGGKRTRDLIRDKIASRFANATLSPLYDSALLGELKGELAFTTDGYVVTPAFFPGADIGHLCVCGTVNDLAVCGAQAVALSLGLILEEGFPMASFEKVLDSIKAASDEAGVSIVCGDTKVVEKGKGDGVFITTAGVGVVHAHWRPAPEAFAEGDKVILTGTMGDHGAAILVARNNLQMSSPVKSDAAPLASMLLGAVDAFGSAVRFMRDPTRGGVGVTLNEIAETAGKRIVLDEALLPVSDTVRGLCELLGFDPLYLANEGKALVVVEGSKADAVVSYLRTMKYGTNACVIGEVAPGKPGVALKTAIGGLRAVDYPVGDQLPRIC